MSRLIDSKELIKRINNAEENFKADHMETIASDDGDAFVDGVLSGVFNIREMVNQAPTVLAIPLDKVKAARESIYNLNCTDYGSMFSYEAHTGAKDMQYDVLNILDKLIAESEE